MHTIANHAADTIVGGTAASDVGCAIGATAGALAVATAPTVIGAVIGALGTIGGTLACASGMAPTNPPRDVDEYDHGYLAGA